MVTSGQQLVDTLVEKGVLYSPELISAFRTVDRRGFVLTEEREQAYVDEALPIGFGQTISQPFTVAFMLELLAPQRGERVLDVGSGSGWTTALLAEVVGEKGRVWGVERMPGLVAFGRENLRKYDYPQAQILPAGTELGLPAEAPFQKILVSAAADSLPTTLTNQLAPSGVMVIPIGRAIWRITKSATNELEQEKYEGFVFVPLVS